MNFFLYAIGLFGFCYIVGLSKISHPARHWLSRLWWMKWPLELLECPACLSTWIGFFVGMYTPAARWIVGRNFGFFDALIISMLSAGASAILGLLTGIME